MIVILMISLYYILVSVILRIKNNKKCISSILLELIHLERSCTIVVLQNNNKNNMRYKHIKVGNWVAYILFGEHDKNG